MSSGTTLDALHALVPAAEEIDLADEAAWHRLLRSLDQPTRRPPAAPADESVEEPPGDPELSIGQALGLLEHVLGAESVDEP